ncbi:MAG: hypothetical protein ACTSX6_06905 [Candidatus Heimdallarchaeaceae archaeon]
MKISDVTFEGPFEVDKAEIPKNRAGVYAILCKKSDGKYYVMDVGESGQSGIRIGNHDRKPCWEKKCDGTLSVYIRYMPTKEYTPEDRRKLESKIRKQYDPPCGKK